MPLILTDGDVPMLREQMAKAQERSRRLAQAYPADTLCTRLAVDTETLLAMFDGMVADQTNQPDQDDLVDVIGELQGRLPRGSAITIQIPPSRDR